MLLQLSIHHLALIDEMTIDFAPGMNVLTGETGAGKSIVVDAVNLVLGERATKELITAGEAKARVEAVFDIAENEQVKTLLEEMELLADEEIASISRELTSAGKNICRSQSLKWFPHSCWIFMASMSISCFWIAETMSAILMVMPATRLLRFFLGRSSFTVHGVRRRQSWSVCAKMSQNESSGLICCAFTRMN